MKREELLELLSSTDATRFVENRILSGVPWIFSGKQSDYDDWRSEVAAAAGIGASSVFLVGSAATGYSLSPYKAGRPFRSLADDPKRPSDIDIAIVDSELFTSTWDQLVGRDRKRLLGMAYKERLTMHRNVYFGCIPESYSATGTKPAGRFRALAAAASRRRPFRGLRAGSRVYRRREDLRAYHVQSLASLLEALKAATKENQ